MRAVLFLHVAREYVPAAKANFARIVINGENWGIYQNVEQYSKEFVKENFREESGGARWKAAGPSPQSALNYLGDNPAQYQRTYELKTKDDPAAWAALIDLCRKLSQTPPDQLEKTLEPIFDIDGALRFLALDAGLVNNDGYWTRASDYSIYRDAGGKFHVFPHDVNETFWLGAGGARGGPNAPGSGPNLDPLVGLNDNGKPLRSKLLAVPALRQKYLGYVREISTKWLDWSTIGPVIERYKALIDAETKADTRKHDTYEAFLSETTGATRSLKTFIIDRRQYLSWQAP
jgi:spore coat protein CotH